MQNKKITWTNEETTLLMQVIIDYKASKTSIALDWETTRNKFDDIMQKFIERYRQPNSTVSKEEVPQTENPSIFMRQLIKFCLVYG